MLFKIIGFEIIILLCITDLSQSQTVEVCSIDIARPMDGVANHLTWPLVLDPHEPEFNEAMANGFIVLKEGDRLRLACNGNGNRFSKLNTADQLIYVECSKGTKFEYNGGFYDFYSHFSCVQTPENTVIPIQPVQNNILNFNIGFQVTNNIFIPLIEIRYDTTLNLVVETKHKIYKGLSAEEKQAVADAGNFDRFRHPVDRINNLYSQETVNAAMDRIIGRQQREKYFRGQSFIARGHMAARADFPFASQQLATFYYLNVNPQFQGFNNGNWRELESFIRTREEAGNITTTVQQLLELDDENGYLHKLPLGDNTVPIPLLFKKTFEFESKGTYKFVGFNFPTIENLDERYINMYNNLKREIGRDCKEIVGLSENLLKNVDKPDKGLFICVRSNL